MSFFSENENCEIVCYSMIIQYPNTIQSQHQNSEGKMISLTKDSQIKEKHIRGGRHAVPKKEWGGRERISKSFKGFIYFISSS